MMDRRGISEKTVMGIIQNPGQSIEVRPGRMVLQSRIEILGKEELIRIFVDVDRKPAEVVTAYRTSKITKYWRTKP